MALVLTTTYAGQIASDPTNYPQGKARNISAPGVPDGTPLDEDLVNDLLGLEQALLLESGVTPSGVPDTAVTSQYLQALRILWNLRTVTHDMASDADYTLTAGQNKYRRLIITDTGVVLTAARNIVVAATPEREIVAKNETAQDLTFKTSAGTGITVAAGTEVRLYVDGIDVITTPTATFATAAENAAGTTEGKAVDPLGIREAFNATGSAPVYACRAWVHFNGTGTVAIGGSGNVASITDLGTGDYRINFTTAMPDANYAVQCSGKDTDDSSSSVQGIHYYNKTTTSVSIRTNSNTGAASDWEAISVCVFR